MEKLKQFWVWVATPFVVLMTVIWFLLTKNRTLGDQLNKEKATRELGKTLGDLERQKEAADDAEAQFNRGLADLKRDLGDDE
jgi:hypothetical protein